MSARENELSCPSCLSPLISVSGQSSIYHHLSTHAYYRVFQLIRMITPKMIRKIYQKIRYGNSVSARKRSGDIPLNLEPGDWIEVLPFEEIQATLDNRGAHKGMHFMVEMKKFCGLRFRVFKTLKVIKLEATGEIRKMKTPTVLLEGVYCDGINHGGCDRACFHYWREVWLKRVSDR